MENPIQERLEMQVPYYNMHDTMIGLMHWGSDEFSRDCRYAEVQGKKPVGRR